MCDASNAQAIVGELLKYLSTADYAIREEMVLKIAILTEKYATEVKWYVDISLRLIAMAGDHVSDEVWQRVIQIITNNEELQVYAAQTALQYVKQEQCHETLIKIGAYTLGEFGHLIADNPGCTPYEQFNAIQSKMPNCSFGTRAIILSSFVKFINLFPEIKPILLQVFNIYSHSLDSELQQRACEYLALATMPNDNLLQTVCDEMPPYPERASALLSRLHSKHAGTGDKRTWIVGGKSANTDSKEVLLSQPTGGGLKRSFTTTGKQIAAANGASNGSGNGDTQSDLAGLDLVNSNGQASDATNFASAAHLSAGWEKGYNQLLLKGQGILYEDGQIQVGIRTEYRNELGCIILYFTNKFSSSIGSFTTTLHNRCTDQLGTNVTVLPEAKIAPSAQSRQTIMFEALSVFAHPPTIRISYLAGALQAVTLQLPVTIHKYMDKAELAAEDFFKRWKQIGGDAREAQKIFGVVKGKSISQSFTRKVVEGFNWGILDGVDPNPKNMVGATVLHTTKSGSFGCLMRLEPNYDTDVSKSNT
jgi:AP-2 complex subunit alpha